MKMNPSEADHVQSELTRRLHKPDVLRIAAWATESTANRDAMWTLSSSADRRVAANALWCMTHLRGPHCAWLQTKQHELIDRALTETEVSKKRMLLQLLREQEYHEEDLRIDFLDFCLSKINSECEPYAIRSFSIYIAHKMCSLFPELMAELNDRLDMLACQQLSPGLRCAFRKCRS